MKRLQYSVSGMSCAACVGHVERAARSVVGKEDKVSVSLLTSTVAIILGNDIGEEEKTLLEQRLSAAVRAAGYRLLTTPPTTEKTNKETQKRVIKWVISAIFTLILMYVSMGHMVGLPQPPFLVGTENALWLALLQLLLTLPVVVLNFKFFKGGISALIHLSPNMDTLIAVGSGASLIYGTVAVFMIAFANGNSEVIHSWVHDLYFESAAMILTLVSLGKLLESRAKDRAADAVKSLSALSPKFATVKRGEKEEIIPTGEIQTGDLVLIRSGDLIAVDGEVVFGEGSVDESALTGESMPVDKLTGDTVSSACVLTSGFLTVKATRVGEDTSFSRLVRLLEDAASSKAPIARVADRVSLVFVPCVMAISLLTFVLWMLLSGNVESAFRSAIAVLVISCPCALGLATPTAITVGIGRGAKFGILFRNAESLERLCAVKTVVFDKTGTVTEGRPVLSDIFAYEIQPDKLLTLAAAVEYQSSHPLALAVYQAAQNAGIELPQADEFSSLTGIGARALVEGQIVEVGKPDAEFRSFLQTEAKKEPTAQACAETLLGGARAVFYDRWEEQALHADFAALEAMGKTAVLVKADGRAIGVLGISDRIREDSKIAIDALKKDERRCLMLTGDNERTAAFVAQTLNLDGFRASLLPEDKERAVKSFCEEFPTAMVGDGINDAPALVSADVGIAIGAGTEIAIDSADVVLMGNSLVGVADACLLSRKTLRIIKQNLFWALIYNAICIPVAAGAFYPLFGWQLSPMLASAAMSFSSVCVVTNALRLRRVPLHAPESNPKQSCNSFNDQKGESDMFFKKKEKSETYVISVEGMMCPRCVAHVKNALEAVNGVLSVEVSLEQKSATVTASCPLSDLHNAIIKAGYEVI